MRIHRIVHKPNSIANSNSLLPILIWQSFLEHFQMRHKRADSAWIAINCLYQVNHLNQFELNFSFSSNKHALAHTHTQLSKGLKCWARANCNKHVHYHTIYSTISLFVAATTHRDHNPFCLENNDKPDKCRQVIEEGTQRAFVAWFIKQLYFSHL